MGCRYNLRNVKVQLAYRLKIYMCTKTVIAGAKNRKMTCNPPNYPASTNIRIKYISYLKPQYMNR
jgi:hypothetical protein